MGNLDDAGCEPRLPHAPYIEDEDTPWLVLFASVLSLPRPYLLERAEEWRELFGGTDGT